MHQDLPALLGVLAGLLNVVGFFPYFRDILRGKTKPERAMWWVYAVLFGLLFAAQLDAGASWLLVVTAAYVLSSVLIAILSVRYGYGSFHRRDTFSLVVAALGLLVWLVTDQPLLAIIMVIIVDFAGFWLTLVKTWHAPHSETLISWQLACVSAVLSLFAAGTWDITILIYPVYAVIATAFIVWLIMHRRTKVAEDPSDFSIKTPEL